MFPVLRSGNTNTVARPATGESGALLAPTLAMAAASYCRGPSIRSSGRRSRARRVASLKDDMARPDATSAEKLRRLLESLQVEAGYGASVEVTEAQIDVAGEELYVDVLRLGRLALFWKTPDGERVGEFDQASASWVELDGKYRRNIINAMEMATRMRPIELIALPLGRISR